MVEFYCVKCKKKVEIPEKDCKKVNFRRSIKAWKSSHKDCGTGVYRIIGFIIFGETLPLYSNVTK